MVIVMLLVATLVFFITRLAPGDPAAVMLGEQATAADIAQLRASYGLDKPLPRAVRLLAGRAGARQSRPVDLPAAAGDAGAARARRADVLPDAVLDRHRDADRRSVRHRRRRVARQDGRPGLLGIRDAGREHPELLVRTDPDADLRGGPRLVPGGRLRRSRRAAVRSPASSGAAVDRARRGQLGADPALHAGEHARRPRRGSHPHGARQGAVGSDASCCTTRCATR